MDTAHSHYFDATSGLLNASVFGNADLYERELSHVFTRCWSFLGPESWLSQRGDYVTSTIGEEPCLVWRGLDGELRAFSNFCVTAKRLVANSARERTDTLHCQCHGWGYGSDGHLIEVPESSLEALPRLDVYKGLVFGCLDPAAPGLLDYLGEFVWYLDTFLDRREGGVEAYGDPPLRWLVDANWKLPMEAFSGDVYREATAHAATATALGTSTEVAPEDGLQIATGPGTVAARFAGQAEQLPSEVATYEDAGRQELEQRLGRVRAGTVFPQTGIIFPNLAIDWPTRTLHAWHPRGPAQTEVYSYCFVDKVMPLAVREAMRRYSHFLYGPAEDVLHLGLVNLLVAEDPALDKSILDVDQCQPLVPFVRGNCHRELQSAPSNRETLRREQRKYICVLLPISSIVNARDAFAGCCNGRRQNSLSPQQNCLPDLIHIVETEDHRWWRSWAHRAPPASYSSKVR